MVGPEVGEGVGVGVAVGVGVGVGVEVGVEVSVGVGVGSAPRAGRGLPARPPTTTISAATSSANGKRGAWDGGAVWRGVVRGGMDPSFGPPDDGGSGTTRP